MTPCRHGGKSHFATIWSMYCLPEKGCLGIADGTPCNTAFMELEV